MSNDGGEHLGTLQDHLDDMLVTETPGRDFRTRIYSKDIHASCMPYQRVVVKSLCEPSGDSLSLGNDLDDPEVQNEPRSLGRASGGSNDFSNTRFKNLQNLRMNHEIFISCPEDHNPVPLFCPLCEFPMRTQSDSLSFREMGCCEYCDSHWRPYLKSGEEIDKTSERWKTYMTFRAQKAKRTIILK